MADPAPPPPSITERLRDAAQRLLPSAAAPAVLAASGAMYVSGYTKRQTKLYQFGLSEDAFGEAIQETIAEGFIIIIITPAILATLYGVFHTVLGLFRFIFRRRSKSRTSKSKNNASLPQSIRLYLNLMMALLALGVVGGVMGALEAYSLRLEVSWSCSRCYIYTLEKEAFVGRLVAQNQEHTAVLDRGQTVRVFKTGELRSVGRLSDQPVKAAERRSALPNP